MKIPFTIILLASLIFSAKAQTANGEASSTDVASVTQSIDDETNAFMARDQKKWDNAWMHSAYVSWSSERSPNQILGWENLKEAFAYNFAPNQPPRSTMYFTREHMQISVVENTATASFIQTASGADRKPLSKSREVRVLEKENNQWKVIYVYSRTI